MHPIIWPTLQVCQNLFSGGKISTCNSPLMPTLGNPQFIPGIQKGPFALLMERGLFQASHFLVSGNWPTMQELMQKNGPFQLDFWQAAQIRHFLGTVGASSRL